MKEKDFQTLFSKWAKYRYEKNAVFELKLTRTKSIPFSAVQDHQVAALRAAKHGSIVYKIPDIGFQNPFDCLRMGAVEAFVVVMYYVPREKFFYMIDIDDWTHEQEISDRKSLTRDRAREIGKEFDLKVSARSEEHHQSQ